MLALSMDRDAAHASKSFTVQYKGEQYDANRYAQTVADGLGFDHHLATIGVEASSGSCRDRMASG